MRLLKEHTFNLFSQRKRIFAVIIAVLFLFVCLSVRLFFVQIIDGEKLQSRAAEQWTRDLPLTAERGKIYDTTGSSLAVSYTTYNVYTRARQITDANSVSAYLADKLSLSFDSVLQKVLNHSVSEFLIKMQVEKNIAEQIIDKNFKGVYLSENIKRYYPYGNLLTQVLGFTSIDNKGQAGLELYADKYLKGTNGKSLVQSDLQGKELENSLRYYIPAIAGADITLTIDSKIQLCVEQTLEKIMAEQKAKSVSCIIMRANTGEIVSMSTKPSFDLNNPPRSDVSNLLNTVKNTTVVDVYEPGSTFKILTMSASIEEGVAKLNNHFYCSGSRIVDGQRIKCWKSVGHGSQTLTEGIVNSCNCVFMDLALRLGTEKFYQYMKAFGLGTKTGVDIAGESSGIIMPQSSVKNVDLARMGFGHAVAMSPLQLCTAVCSAVNGGKLISPYLVKKIVSCDNKLIQENEPVIIRQVVSQSTSQTINTMLQAVTNKTGPNTFVEGYNIGGKTGTAQKYENGQIARGKYISSFVGTYPADSPEYVMLLTVDEPSAGAYYGSIVASPYAKEIFKGMFEYLNISPINLDQAERSNQKVEMPDVTGLSLSLACATLKKMGINYEIDGEGAFVTSQLPPAGANISLNDTILICTN